MTTNAYAVWFTATVGVVRLALWLRPTPSPTVRGFRLHHWMYGAAILVTMAIVEAPGWREFASIPYPLAALYAVGAGLFADQALAIGGRYPASLAGTAALVALLDAVLLWLP